MEARKRKRSGFEDADDAPPAPRITYHANGRTFERLFNERSLLESKALVRKKLCLPQTAEVQLEQIRDGKLIDLEDDEDFAAFQARVHDVLSLDVKVTVQSEAPIPSSHPTIPLASSLLERSQAPSSPSVANVNESKKKMKTKLPPPPSPDTHAPPPPPLQPSTSSAKPKSQAAKRKATTPGPEASPSAAASALKKRKSNNGDVAAVNSTASDPGKQTGKSRGKAKESNMTLEVLMPKPKASASVSTRAVSPVQHASGVAGNAEDASPPPKKRKTKKAEAEAAKKAELDAEQAATADKDAAEKDAPPPPKKRKIKKSEADAAKKAELEAEQAAAEAKAATDEAEAQAAAAKKARPSKPARSVAVTSKASEKEGSAKAKKNKETNETNSTNAAHGDSEGSDSTGLTAVEAHFSAEEQEPKPKGGRKNAASEKSASSAAKLKPGEQTTSLPAVVPEEALAPPPAKKKKSRAMALPRLSIDPTMIARIEADMDAFLSRKSPTTTSADQSPAAKDKVKTIAPVEPNTMAEDEECEPEVQLPSTRRRSLSRLRQSWGPDDIEEVVEATPEPESASESESLPEPAVKASNSSPPAITSPAPRRPLPAHIPSDISISRGSSPAGRKTRSSKSMPCPVCLEIPFHLRYRCPIILAGPEAIEARLEELKVGKSQPGVALVQELQMILQTKKIRASLARSAASSPPPVSSPEVAKPTEPAATRSSEVAETGTSPPQRKPTVPKGSRMSEVTIENGDEGSSNEDSDGDGSSSSSSSSSEDSDDEDQVNNIGQPKIPSAFPGVTSLDDLNLEALIRGPASQSKSVLDDIPTRTSSEEEEEEVMDDIEADEEDEDDQRLRKLTRKAEQNASSDEDEGEDPDLPVTQANDEDASGDGDVVEPVPGPVKPTENASGTKEASAGSNGSADPDEATKVEPSDEEEKLEDDNAESPLAKSTMSSSAGIPVDAAGSPIDEPSPLPDTTDAIQVDISPKKPTSPVKRTDQSDPIEGADDSLEAPSEPRESLLGSSSITVNAKRPRSPTASSVELQWPPSPPASDKAEPKLQHSSPPKPETPAHAENSPERASAEAMPPPSSSQPKKRGRPPLSAEVKAAREKAKLEEKNRKAEKEDWTHKAAEKKPEKAPPAKRVLRGSQGASQSPQITQASEPITPVATPHEEQPHSLDKWAAIVTLSSPEAQDGESQMMDELRSSSETPPPEEAQPLTSPTPQSGKQQQDSGDITLKSRPLIAPPPPLFELSESQIPFPYSQYQEDTMPVEADDSPTESESEEDEHVPQATPKITSSAPAKFRGLRDLASQEMFNSQMSPIAFTSTPAPKHKAKVVEDSDDDDSSDDDSGDSDAKETSHIPKSRRAGAQSKPKKAGLLSRM